jgi:lipopolysaccharide biosynthesis protein
VLKLIAFYLPQYHQIPENDLWWGKGFTEWTNVRRAQQNFAAHDQPRVPADFGYYSLLDTNFQETQAKIAADFGLFGFCYYVYWFAGRRLLEKPLDAMLANPKIRLPFCICWANENWTRRWDGLENDILVSQPHDVENDNRFIVDMEKYLSDERYMTISGRKVVLVYRADIMADAKATTKFWRDHMIKRGLGDPYLIAVDFYNVDDPAKFGFDALVEFPPHKSLWTQNYYTDHLAMKNPNFRGEIFDYQKVRDMYLARRFEVPAFRGVMPSWDNTARRQDTPHIFHGSSVESFERWLLTVARQTIVAKPRDERLVFINAWNEWGEGCYLEPDKTNGFGNLEAVRRVVEECAHLAASFDATVGPLDARTRALLFQFASSYERSLAAFRFLDRDTPEKIRHRILTSDAFFDSGLWPEIRDRLLRDKIGYKTLLEVLAFKLKRKLRQMTGG